MFSQARPSVDNVSTLPTTVMAATIPAFGITQGNFEETGPELHAH
ncbi:hypothetical protein AB0K14_12955 [Actinosynnema sp. NPDC050801]